MLPFTASGHTRKRSPLRTPLEWRAVRTEEPSSANMGARQKQSLSVDLPA